MAAGGKHKLDHSSSIRRNVCVRTLEVTSRSRVKARGAPSHVVQNQGRPASSLNDPEHDQVPPFCSEEPVELDEETWLPIPPPISAKQKRNGWGTASIASVGIFPVVGCNHADTAIS